MLNAKRGRGRILRAGRWPGAGFFDIGVAENAEKAEILKCQNSERDLPGRQRKTRHYGGLRQVTVNYGGKLFSAAVRALAIRGGRDRANKPKST